MRVKNNKKRGDIMYFNFLLFSKLVERAYKNIKDCPYELDSVLSVFRYYLEKYESTFKAVHPNIQLSQIEAIIEKMPYIDDVHSREVVIEPKDYKALIDGYFKTQFRSCDYRLNHFFSGDVRLLRFYEAVL